MNTDFCGHRRPQRSSTRSFRDVGSADRLRSEHNPTQPIPVRVVLNSDHHKTNLCSEKKEGACAFLAARAYREAYAGLAYNFR